MAKREAIPDEVLKIMAAKFRLLGDPTRLAILRALMMGGEMNVSQIVEQMGRRLANISKHLKQLAGAGPVSRRKEGPQVFYRLNDLVVEKICHFVCDSILKEMKQQLEQHRRLLGGKGESHTRGMPRAGWLAAGVLAPFRAFA